MKEKQLHNTLFQPTRPSSVAAHAQWLSGEGAGSWFAMDKENECYVITRFSPSGQIECKGKFILENGNNFDVRTNYQLTYLSHCSWVTIIQNETKYQFKLKEKCTI